MAAEDYPPGGAGVNAIRRPVSMSIPLVQKETKDRVRPQVERVP